MKQEIKTITLEDFESEMKAFLRIIVKYYLLAGGKLEDLKLDELEAAIEGRL